MSGPWRIALSCFVSVLVSAQQPEATTSIPPQQTCVLEGTAVDALTGEALRKVTVRLASGANEYVGATDTAGQFHFEGFRTGDYELTGERAGYLKVAFGARSPEAHGTVLHFGAGDKLSDLTLKLTASSSVSGKIVDETGEPVPRAYVAAIRPTWRKGHREFSPAGQTNTNDAGEYRIGELAPGPYYLYAGVSAEPLHTRWRKSRNRRHFPSCIPTRLHFENAAQLNIQQSQNLTGVDFHLHTGNVFHVRGRVIGSESSSSFCEDQEKRPRLGVPGLRHQANRERWNLRYLWRPHGELSRASSKSATRAPSSLHAR